MASNIPFAAAGGLAILAACFFYIASSYGNLRLQTRRDLFQGGAFILLISCIFSLYQGIQPYSEYSGIAGGILGLFQMFMWLFIIFLFLMLLRIIIKLVMWMLSATKKTFRGYEK
jgi:hypothetical protein